MLARAGLDTLLLEQSGDVGTSWHAHYDRLHLHTVRWLSGLPGFPIPRAFGKWVARDDVHRYLRAPPAQGPATYPGVGPPAPRRPLVADDFR